MPNLNFKSMKIFHLFKFISIISIFVLYACNVDDNSFSIQKEILSERTLLGNNIYLPAGTYWYHTNKDKTEVKFELPDGYIFMIKNHNTGKFYSSNTAGGYSCTCTGTGSCTTFYTKDMGYGCLQNNCNQSCNGKKSLHASNEEIVGVLNVKNDLLDSDLNHERASLSAEGVEGFLEMENVKEEIKRTYDIIYKYVQAPDFNNPNFENQLNAEQYTFAKVMLYGMELGIIIPNDPGLQDLFPSMITVPIGDMNKTCNCINGSQGGNCELKKKGLFNYVAYYCSGCTTCSMN